MAKLIFTDENCLLNAKPRPRLPVFVRENGDVDWPATDWLRQRLLAGLGPSSVTTYARHILDLMLQMEVDGLWFDRLTDDYLERYKEAVVERGGPTYINDMLHTQVSLLKWMEQNGFVRGLIGIGAMYPVRIDENGRHPLVKRKGTRSKVANLPSEEAIEATKANLPRHDASLRLRDELLMQWQHTQMLRGGEACALTVNMIPDSEEIKKLLAQERTFGLKLTKTKGGRQRTVQVHPLLLQMTRDWIDLDRVSIVCAARKRSKHRGQTYVEPAEVFLNAWGLPLSRKSLSNTIRVAFKAAVAHGLVGEHERVWSHGLRHRAITSDLARRKDAGQEGAEWVTKSQSGHASLDSMAPYVHLDALDKVGPSPPHVLHGSRRTR